jgi:hypothetical protein
MNSLIPTPGMPAPPLLPTNLKSTELGRAVYGDCTTEIELWDAGIALPLFSS